MAKRLLTNLNKIHNILERNSLFKWQKRSLNLQEYQSKQLMYENDINVQKFRVISSKDEINKIFKEDNSFKFNEYVIKAQVLAGGRGKGHFKNSGMKSGVHLTKDKKTVIDVTEKMLNDYLVTAQTTKDGVLVKKVMVAEALDINKELYLAILLDRESNGPVIVVSEQGGMDIEEVAEKDPDAIKKFVIPFDEGDLSYEFASEVAEKGLNMKSKSIIDKAVKEIQNLYKLFLKIDSTQIEINPLGITNKNDVVCFDAKIQFDENAEFRHKWMKELEIEESLNEDPREALAKEYNLNFVAMEGNIGCLVNGAGLAMATMDIIHHYGGNPANFLDVGGGVTQKGVENAFKLITQDSNVKAILVNIFGGIVNCETIANGLVSAINLVNVPLVVRLEGTNVEAARKVLEKVPSIITASDLDDAAHKAVEAARER